MRAFRQLGKQGLHRAGYYRHQLSQQQATGVATLCFHSIRASDEHVPFGELHVTLDTFTSVCHTIATHCSPISLNDLRAARQGLKRLPAHPVLLTFDDGYASVLARALPILEKFGIPAAVFVCPEPIQAARHFWFDAMAERTGVASVEDARAMDYAAWKPVAARVARPANPGESHRPLTVAELRRLAASPLIEIGAHTLSHPVLARASVDDQRREVTQSRVALREMLGAPVRAFAYPFGEPGKDFDAATVSVVSDAGFDLACTTVPSFTEPASEALGIPRYVMLDSVDGPEFAHRMAHSWRPRAADGPDAGDGRHGQAAAASTDSSLAHRSAS